MYTSSMVLKAAGMQLLLCSTPFGAVAAPQNSRFTFYTMPTAESGPCDLTTGPDGAIWVSDFLVPKVARLDPDTGHIDEYTVPYTGPVFNETLPGKLGQLARKTAIACASQPGQDGKMYFSGGQRNQLVQMNITTNDFTIHDLGNPLGNLQPMNDIYAGPMGMFISQTTANKISVLDYKTSVITDFFPPTLQSGPVGLYLASDGNMWFCEFVANKLGRLNFTSGEIKEFPLPEPNIGPAVMRAETRDAQGHRYVWATGFLGNKMVSIDIDTFAIKLYDLPEVASFPTEDTVDALGNIWYSTATYNTLNKLDPSTGQVENIPQPGSIVVEPGVPPAADIAMHFGPGNDLWFTELARNRVGRYKLYQ